VIRFPVPCRATRHALVAVVALVLFPGCLTYEKSQTKITFDGTTGVARVQTTYWNIASTEPARSEQWQDFELDSLRRSDPYFATSYLRSPGGGRVGKRRVWIEKGRIHASASVTTRDLNELAEGWSADSTGFRYTSNLEITATNGRRTDDEKPTVTWPKRARLLTVVERDPHFGEAIPFRPEIRDSLAKRLPPVVKPVKRATKHSTSRRARSTTKRSRTH
jgi:hypothetical protein